MDSRPGRLPALLTFAVVLTVALVVWGGVVRLSGSGLAIPDWPLANGKLLPKPHPNVLIEWGHRFLAMLVSVTTLTIAIVVFRSKVYRPRLMGLTIALLITLAFQVFMGARVVLEELPVDRVVAHLLLAFTFFGILVTMRHKAGEESGAVAATPAGGRARGLAGFAHLAAGFVFLQAGLGAWTSSSGAALACPDFPTCQGMWLPPMHGLVGIHYAHRLGGYVVFLTVLALCLAYTRRRSAPPRHRQRAPQGSAARERCPSRDSARPLRGALDRSPRATPCLITSSSRSPASSSSSS
jgi:cytochrome c oxidase assembly protein subunit 15